MAQAAPKAPAPVRWIVERCLAKDPEERYASSKDLARDLKQRARSPLGNFGIRRDRSRSTPRGPGGAGGSRRRS